MNGENTTTPVTRAADLSHSRFESPDKAWLDPLRERLTFLLIRREVVPWLRHSYSGASSSGCTT